MTWEKQEGVGFWTPEKEGDELIGEITFVNTEGLYGIQYTIKNEKGDEIKTPSHKVLQNRMQKAQVGTEVKIVYKGTEPPTVKGNNPTEMYEVYFEK